MPHRRPAARAVVRATAAAALAVAALTGCSGTSCDALPGLTAERDAARTQHLARAQAPGADLEEVVASHDALHALEQRVYDLEQRCG